MQRSAAAWKQSHNHTEAISITVLAASVMYSNPRFELEIQVHIIVQPFVTAYKDY
jgi:hypothetical protein